MTATTAQTPSQNPADGGTLTGVMRAAFRKILQSTDGMLPAKVISVTSNRKFVAVQPLIQIQATDGSLTTRAQINSVPVFAPGAGGFVMSFPVATGDLGWIFAADRDISIYLQKLDTAKPNTPRLKSFSDAVFIPDAARNFAFSGETGAAVWQSTDGSTMVSLSSSKINITHGTLVEIDCPSVTMSGTLAVTGNITTDADITADGTVTGTTDVTGGGIDLSTHTHSGVTTGSDDTGEPNS